MGKWDHFGNKSGKEPFKTDLTPTDIQTIRSHCIGMTEPEKDKVVSEIVHTYDYIKRVLEKTDSSKPDHTQVEAMICMLYGAYNELSSPPAMLVVACKIAQSQNFTPSTVKVMLMCLNKMMDSRFESSDRSDKGFGSSKTFKFE